MQKYDRKVHKQILEVMEKAENEIMAIIKDRKMEAPNGSIHEPQEVEIRFRTNGESQGHRFYDYITGRRQFNSFKVLKREK